MLVPFKVRFADDERGYLIEKIIEVDDENAKTPAYAWMLAITKAMSEATDVCKLDRLTIDLHDYKY